jgi:hypothetical protein
MSSRPRAGLRAAGAALGLLVLVLTGVSPAVAAVSAAPTVPTVAACPDRPAQPARPPVLAHFYQWFTPSSWDRAKIDYPAVGRYSSDDVTVMTKQVAQARSAGIDGFIVGWRSTPALDARLASLRKVAAAAHFKLAITYQAQDFNRNRLAVPQVAGDLQKLADTYGHDPVFQVLGPRPVVALSGTWNYSEQEIHTITAPVASRLLVLATEKSVAGYQRVASAVEGELYYWSSPDPQRNGGYAKKLIEMANAARARCGLWIAPVAPGFDARKVGGQSTVDRRDGATLRAEWQAAEASAPDAIGIISWNEYSESTQIEPSATLGTRYLDTVKNLVASPPPPAKETDSSAPQGAGSLTRSAIALTAVVGGVAGVTLVGIRRRRRTLTRP